MDKARTSPVSAPLLTNEELVRLYRCTWTLHGGMPFTQFCNLRESLIQSCGHAPPDQPAALADKVIADPTIVYLRECGFRPSAYFEATLRTAIIKAFSQGPDTSPNRTKDEK